MPQCVDRLSRSAARSRGTRGRGTAGFTLFEVLLGLTLMALVAALALPGPGRPAGPAALRTTAYQISALLRSVRTEALAQGHAASATVDAAAGRIEGAGSRIDMPAGVTLGPADRRWALIRFAPDGTATGGDLLLTAATSRMTVAVNPDTGAIALAP